MRIFLLILIMIAGGITVGYVYQNELLPVKQIQIDGELQRIDMQDVEQILLPYVQHGLLGIDVMAIQQSLMGVPWVAQARVSRMWPDTVHIWLAEPQPVAVWANNGVVSQEGIVYYLPAGAELPNLPVFEGLEGQSPIMLEHYQQMQSVLASQNLNIVRLVLTPRGAWELELDNGIVVRLGQSEPLERLQRFLTVYPELISDPNQHIEYVDLRYPNGLAVKSREKSL
ncbi:MAG: cell division protein FtsQ/DivIB [Gammaproteobacteria bacterium]